MYEENVSLLAVLGKIDIAEYCIVLFINTNIVMLDKNINPSIKNVLINFTFQFKSIANSKVYFG